MKNKYIKFLDEMSKQPQQYALSRQFLSINKFTEALKQLDNDIKKLEKEILVLSELWEIIKDEQERALQESAEETRQTVSNS